MRWCSSNSAQLIAFYDDEGGNNVDVDDGDEHGDDVDDGDDDIWSVASIPSPVCHMDRDIRCKAPCMSDNNDESVIGGGGGRLLRV